MGSKIISFLKYLAKRFVDKLAGKIVDKSFYALSALFLVIFIAAIVFDACPPIPRVVVVVQPTVDPVVNLEPHVNATLFQININSNNQTTNTFIINNPPSFQTASVTTQDRCGRDLEIELGMLPVGHRWVYESDSKVGISEDESADINEVFKFIPNTVEKPVITVGLASHEHKEDNPAREVTRALSRVDKLTTAAASHFTVNRPELYSLNLGYYKRPSTLSPEESAIERRVILIQINKRAEGAELNSGVRNALIKLMQENKLVEGFDPDAYSNFPPDMFSVKPRTPNAHNEPVPCVEQPLNQSPQR